MSRVKSDLLEVRISGRGADRCDQDDEIYIMVQEIWSGSEILRSKSILKGDELPPGFNSNGFHSIMAFLCRCGRVDG